MWTMTPRPPPWNRLLVKHTIIGPEALQNAQKEWIWNHVWNLHRLLHSGSHAADDLQWIGRMSDPLLVNKNILGDRSGIPLVKLIPLVIFIPLLILIPMLKFRLIRLLLIMLLLILCRVQSLGWTHMWRWGHNIINYSKSRALHSLSTSAS